MEGAKIEKLAAWFSLYEETVKKLEVELCNIYNMDETAVQVSEHHTKPIAILRSLPVVLQEGPTSELWICIETISANGRVLTPQFIFKGEHLGNAWFSLDPDNIPEFRYAVSKNGWTSTDKALEWLVKIFIKETEPADPEEGRLLILDGQTSHTTDICLDMALKNKVWPLFLPPHSSHLTQPLDVVAFSHLKRIFRNEVDERVRESVKLAVGKADILMAYHRSRKQTLTKSNILASWNRAGLVPFNPLKCLDRKEVVRSESQVRSFANVDININEVLYASPSREISDRLNTYNILGCSNCDQRSRYLFRTQKNKFAIIEAKYSMAKKEIIELQAKLVAFAGKPKQRRLRLSPNKKTKSKSRYLKSSWGRWC